MNAGDQRLKAFPFVEEMEAGRRGRLFSAVVSKHLDSGEVLLREGADCRYLPLLLSGSLRVYKVSERGRELTLYRIEQGESCVVTATCILNKNNFPAIARAELPTEVALVPASLFARFIDESPPWRRYLFGLYSRRLDIMFSLVDEVAFHHVDARIAAFLLETSNGVPVRLTHQNIASEVGTSREVVSRILKDFELERFIETSRGQIMVVDANSLKNRIGF